MNVGYRRLKYISVNNHHARIAAIVAKASSGQIQKRVTTMAMITTNMQHPSIRIVYSPLLVITTVIFYLIRGVTNVSRLFLCNRFSNDL